VQETLIKALRQWPYRGIPENPAGWIMTVARNHALDILRRERRFRERQAALLLLAESSDDPAALADTSDDALARRSLRMMFICCHPAISREAQVALTLKTLGGFGCLGDRARFPHARETNNCPAARAGETDDPRPAYPLRRAGRR